jgi:hypothetical protein
VSDDDWIDVTGGNPIGVMITVTMKTQTPLWGMTSKSRKTSKQIGRKQRSRNKRRSTRRTVRRLFCLVIVTIRTENGLERPILARDVAH